MKTTIVGRQLNVYDDTRSMIGLKLGKLDKYLSLIHISEPTRPY